MVTDTGRSIYEWIQANIEYIVSKKDLVPCFTLCFRISMLKSPQRKTVFRIVNSKNNCTMCSEKISVLEPGHLYILYIQLTIIFLSPEIKISKVQHSNRSSTTNYLQDRNVHASSCLT